jgi:exonuclease SbcD
MRILHTSDWHIGQKIYDQNRIDEHTQFLDWLLDIIIQKNVDVLLISGDIFDSSVPSAEATDLYYRFLFDLYQKTRAHAVIIAGNHDSAVRLAAPAQFLKMGRIYVVGGIRESPQECVIRLDEKMISFAAVPYLNEGDILSHVSQEAEMARSLRYREAIRMIYEDCVSSMPVDDIHILMGHFFLHGGTGGESERLVQIGGTQPVRTDDLPLNVDYIALGHLHRPQRIQNSACPIVYPGSPIPLTFKESEYDKKVFVVDIGGTCDVEEIVIPVFRELIRVEGDLDTVMARASFENWNDTYIEVQVRLDAPQIGIADTIRRAFASQGGRVLVVESVLPDTLQRESISTEDIKTKLPEEIFQDFYKHKFGEAGSSGVMDELLTTFKELLNISREQEVEV